MAGVRRLTPCCGTQRGRLRDKSEVLYASPEFTWVLFGRRAFGREGEWTPTREPRFMFRQLIERTMPGYFDVLGHRYGVDNLLAEFHQHLDLAFCAANWRYTSVIEVKYYRYGLVEWPPQGDWWKLKLRALRAAAAASTEGAVVAASSPGGSASSPGGPGPSAGVGASSQAVPGPSAGVAASSQVVPGPSAGAAASSLGGSAAGAAAKFSSV